MGPGCPTGVVGKESKPGGIALVKRNAFTAVAPAIALCVLMATTNLCAADPAATPTDSTTADDNQPTMELIVQ